MPAHERAQSLQHYLHRQIPLTVAMGVQVRLATAEHVLLYAPLAPNINHHSTVFGGSVAALATLSAWSLMHLRLEQCGVRASVVIQRSAIEYERPIAGDLCAACRFADAAGWARFQRLLERRGRARMTLAAEVLHETRRMASFVGDFVALRAPAPAQVGRGACPRLP